jgi:hypothetical protein
MPTREGREGQESGESADARPPSGRDSIRTSSGSDDQRQAIGKNRDDQGCYDPSSRNEREDLTSTDNSERDPYDFDRDTNLGSISSSDGYVESGTGPGPQDPPSGKTLEEIEAETKQESQELLAEHQAQVDAWSRKVWGEALSLSKSEG